MKAAADSINRLLDAAKDKLACATDTELADVLGVGVSRICNYRKGRAIPNRWMARRIAHVLKLEPATVVLAITPRRRVNEGV